MNKTLRSARLLTGTMFAIVLFAICACKKQAGNAPLVTPAPMYFELLDKNGNSMITSVHDSVAVTYNDNNETKAIKLQILPLSLHAYPDTLFSTSYGGLYISDNALMSNPSYSKTSAVRNFSISLNGVNMGTIYLDYVSYLTAYPNATPAFTFNSTAVVADNSVAILGGSYYNLNLLQLK